MRQDSISTITNLWLRKLLTAAMVTLTMMSALAVVGAPQAEAADSCSGSYDASLQSARYAYERRCGKQWDGSSGKHECKWNKNGWYCFGPRDTPPKCKTDVWALHAKIGDAKANFKQNCGQKWGSSHRDKCVWHTGPISIDAGAGWHCYRRPSS